MKKNKATVMAALAGVVLLGILAVSYMKWAVKDVAQSLPQDRVVAVPMVKDVPDVTFYTPDGKPARIADFTGNVVVLNLWATWCPPCVAELPSLDRLQAQLKDKGLVVLAVSMDRGDINVVTNFVTKRGLENLSVYWDRDKEIAMQWKYSGLPVTFLFDRSGTLIEVIDGAHDWHEGEMRTKIDSLL